MKGILGKKIGMTQVFTESGKLIPVTVIEVEPNVVTQIKTVEKDGYEAYVVGGFVRDYLLNKKSYDIDICTSALPKEIISVLKLDSATVGDNIGITLKNVEKEQLQAGQVVAHSNSIVTTKKFDAELSFVSTEDAVVEKSFTDILYFSIIFLH